MHCTRHHGSSIIIPGLVGLALSVTGCARSTSPEGAPAIAPGGDAGAPEPTLPPGSADPPDAGPGDVESPIATDAGAPTTDPDAGEVPEIDLAACLEAGGVLREVDRVDNNDQVDHGVITTMEMTPEGVLTVAALDGTIKLWTRSDFVGEGQIGRLLYGAEGPAGAEVTDIALVDGAMLTGDVRGLVSRWSIDPSASPDGAVTFSDVVGGTEPDVPITAVAIDPTESWIAHADAEGQVTVRELGGSTVHTLDAEHLPVEVWDLAYLPTGELLVAGDTFVQRRAAGDPNTIERQWWRNERRFFEIAVSEAGHAVAVTNGHGLRLDTLSAEPTDLSWRGSMAVSADLTTDGVLLASVESDFGAGATSLPAALNERKRLWITDLHSGQSIAEAEVVAPVRVRFDPNDSLVFVATRPGPILVFGCLR